MSFDLNLDPSKPDLFLYSYFRHKFTFHSLSNGGRMIEPNPGGRASADTPSPPKTPTATFLTSSVGQCALPNMPHRD
jgi:hypothetical protein